MVEIVLTAFDNDITPAKATVIADPVAEATAEIQVKLSDFINAFKIKTSDDLANPLDPGDIKYYTDISKLESDYSFFATTENKRFNPALARVKLNPATAVDASGAVLTESQLGVVNDYMRDLAKQMFGSPHLTYLFSNDRIVQEDVITKCKDPVVEDIRDLLTAVDKTASSLSTSDSDGKYTTNANDTDGNICRQIFLSLATQVPERFRVNFNSTGITSLPLLAEDSIRFTITLKNELQKSDPTSPQNATSGWTSPAQVRDRVYNIRMILKATPVNAGFDDLVTQFASVLTTPV